MKILFVGSKNSKLGVAPFIRSQGESLVTKGIELDYFTIEGKGIKGYIKSIGKLKEYLKENTYDLVHAHYSFCGWVARLARPKVPVVVSYMGCDVYGDVDKDGKRIDRINIVLAKFLQPFVKQIIVKSKNLENYVYCKKKTHIVPNGVNFERFKPMDMQECRKKLDLPADEKLVLFLGNPEDPRKNIKLLKDALALLTDVPHRLVSPFPIQRDEIPLVINAADVLILTSLMEGSPNVVKEAMACNCPVVSTDVGDAKEIISNTKGCYVCEYKAEDLAEKIKLVLEAGVRTDGRTDINHLQEPLIADRIIDIYKKSLA
ncbi:MAG: glycosyltransferase family 4 protein [bacterium]|nr:glycosyltransferase family 4 protein [bacterium]